jgi:hypothetical protein
MQNAECKFQIADLGANRPGVSIWNLNLQC